MVRTGKGRYRRRRIYRERRERQNVLDMQKSVAELSTQVAIKDMQISALRQQLVDQSSRNTDSMDTVSMILMQVSDLEGKVNKLHQMIEKK